MCDVRYWLLGDQQEAWHTHHTQCSVPGCRPLVGGGAFTGQFPGAFHPKNRCGLCEVSIERMERGGEGEGREGGRERKGGRGRERGEREGGGEREKEREGERERGGEGERARREKGRGRGRVSTLLGGYIALYCRCPPIQCVYIIIL